MKYWLWLWAVKGIGPVTGKHLLTRFGQPQAIYAAGESELLSIPGIGKATAATLRSERSLEKAKHILAECERAEIKILTSDNPLYPKSAKLAGNAPFLLFYKGEIRKDFHSVAIVGSRRCSEYGKEITMQTASFLARQGIAVISGMAKGIDGYAHTASLKAGGYTIAFMGCGLDICYPAEHSDLMKALISRGAVISEYPPGTAARAEHFPTRNRLICSWSDKVLVIEAAEKSGALITADFACKQDKDVFVLPGDVSRTTGKGSNKLLLGGAKAFLDPAQLLPNEKWQRVYGAASESEIETMSVYGAASESEAGAISGQKLARAAQISHPEATSEQKFAKSAPGSHFEPSGDWPNSRSEDLPTATDETYSANLAHSAKLPPIEKKIIDSVSERAKSLELISSETGICQSDLLRQLSTMELKGIIQALPGARYAAKVAGIAN